jgi:hypothetical protein
MVRVPERHTLGGEIPKDRPKRRKPPCAQHDVVARQWQRLEVRHEVFAVDRKWRRTEDA